MYKAEKFFLCLWTWVGPPKYSWELPQGFAEIGISRNVKKYLKSDFFL